MSMYSLSHSECLSMTSNDFAVFNVYFTSGEYPDPIEEVGKINVIISRGGNFSASALLSPTISERTKSEMIECAVGHCRQRFFEATKNNRQN